MKLSSVFQFLTRSLYKPAQVLWKAIALALLLSLVIGGLPARANTEREPINAGVYWFKVGHFNGAVISDEMLVPPLPTYAPTADPQEVERAMVERFWSPDELALYFNVVYVDTGRHHVLIDTGAGVELGAVATLPANLRKMGISPQDIDTVILTHAHPDHIGGIVAPDGQLTFPNARYHIAEAEWQFWTAAAIDLSPLKIPEPFKQNMVAAAHKHLGAIADRVICFHPDQEIVPGIRAIAAAGHTPGQSAVQITSDDAQLMVAADVFFNPAFDLEHPDWQTGFDLDPQQAATTRRRLLDQLANQRTMVMAYHMPFPALGHIRSRGDRYEWEPILWRFSSR